MYKSSILLSFGSTKKISFLALVVKLFVMKFLVIMSEWFEIFHVCLYFMYETDEI
jgi:hypothetical protein